MSCSYPRFSIIYLAVKIDSINHFGNNDIFVTEFMTWNCCFQNLNSDFTDSALGSKEKSPLPYGNFQLRESTMQSILNNPKYGPKSELGEWSSEGKDSRFYDGFCVSGINMYTYLKFGLPRVMPPGMEEV